MDPLAFAAIALALLGFALVSRLLDRGNITPPMVFVALGLLGGPLGLDLVDLKEQQTAFHLLAQLTLVLVLFTDAARLDLRALREDLYLPARLLLVGMPLSILLGAVVGGFLLGDLLGWGGALVLATVLVPTDAAISQAVVNHPRVPLKIRQSLNVESGLNDGVALPVILIALCGANIIEANHTVGFWLRFTLMQLILGPLVGAAVGYIGHRLLKLSMGRGWISGRYQDLAVLSLAPLAFAGAELIHGNGFIAAFVAGLVLGNVGHRLGERFYRFVEDEGQLMSLLVFLGFAASFGADALEVLNARVVLYVVLSLTLIRMLPVALSLRGTGSGWETALFLGWFGPRGIASMLFGMLVLNYEASAYREPLMGVLAATVIASVFAHGLSARPGAVWYGRRMGGDRETAALRERPMGET